MVVQWGKTRRQVFTYGVGEITKFGGRVEGIILSKVDTRKQAYYSYGDHLLITGMATITLTPVKQPKLTWAEGVRGVLPDPRGPAGVFSRLGMLPHTVEDDAGAKPRLSGLIRCS